MAYSFSSSIILGNYIDFGYLSLYRELLRLNYFRISGKKDVLGCAAKMPIIFYLLGNSLGRSLVSSISQLYRQPFLFHKPTGKWARYGQGQRSQKKKVPRLAAAGSYQHPKLKWVSGLSSNQPS